MEVARRGETVPVTNIWLPGFGFGEEENRGIALVCRAISSIRAKVVCSFERKKTVYLYYRYGI